MTRLHEYSQVEVENSKAYFAFVHNQYSSVTFKTIWMQKPIPRSLDLIPKYWGWVLRFSG